MNVQCWLKVRAVKNGYRSKITDPDYFKPTDLRVSKNKPDIGSDEVAVKLNISIPNSLFLKPSLEFNISIPEDAAILPPIDSEVTDNLAEILTGQLGQKVHLIVSGE